MFAVVHLSWAATLPKLTVYVHMHMHHLQGLEKGMTKQLPQQHQCIEEAAHAVYIRTNVGEHVCVCVTQRDVGLCSTSQSDQPGYWAVGLLVLSLSSIVISLCQVSVMSCFATALRIHSIFLPSESPQMNRPPSKGFQDSHPSANLQVTLLKKHSLESSPAQYPWPPHRSRPRAHRPPQVLQKSINKAGDEIRRR
eukprot:1159435-Pelagomonas_calceolata.AAC.13